MIDTLRARVEALLPWVDRPARYIGGEFNSVTKDPAGKLRFAFCFPDVYEIGQSHMGGVILYHLLNEQEGIFCERAFLPWVDMEQAMRREAIPWFTLETCSPVKEMDIVGFTLPYEMLYTNVVNGLDLAGIPLHRWERSEGDPIVIAGGPGTYNPEPVSDFIDLFVIGEAEELVLEICSVVARKDISRAEKLELLSRVQGCYVPATVEVKWRDDGSIESFQSQVPLPVMKRIVADVDKAFFPTKPLVPFLQVVHDRANLEVHRGCVHGCRYCQAGMLYRPQREKSLETLTRQGEEVVKNTGFQEIGLSSLNTPDNTQLVPLIRNLTKAFEEKKVAVGLPSLRVDSFSVGLADSLNKAKKTQITLAPEAGSQRLRDIINKNISEEQILNTVKSVLDAGWREMKLYFMLGLPGETDDDLVEMAELFKKIVALSKGYPGRGLFITTTLSSFVPKPHTPFQFVKQFPRDVLERRIRIVRDRVDPHRVKLRWREFELGELEAIFSLGGRELGKVVERAWRLGCKFDGWSDHFKYDLWMQAFQECGIDSGRYCYTDKTAETIFPWEVVSCGVDKDWLWRDLQAAWNRKSIPNCFFDKCSDCGVNETFDC